MSEHELINSAKRTIEIETAAVKALSERITEDFTKACESILTCKGRVVVTGMGKSGHIGNKIAATLASTGTPAFFVHPGEASHGDMGMITKDDVVIAISNSGNTSEILTLLPLIKRMGTFLISMTGDAKSVLSQSGDANLDISVDKEACPLGLAPTSSTTATLVMGDALAVALLEAKGFTADDFAFSHPGGALGRKLLLKVEDIMHTGDAIPAIPEGTLLGQALLEMSKKGLGMTTILNEQGQLSGIYTDGDLRRTLDKEIDIHNTRIDTIMTKQPKTLSSSQLLAAEALHIMEQYKVSALVVIDKQNTPQGVVHLHDILKAGVA